jgi:hypothetical protein
VEMGLRGLGGAHRVLTLPSTAASTLPLLAPDLPVVELPVPDTWWTPAASIRVRRRIVPGGSAVQLAA